MLASDMKLIFLVHVTWPRPPTIWQMLEMGVVCCTFQSIYVFQKLFCYYALFKFAVVVHEQTAAIIRGIKCDGRQSTKMMFRLLFFTRFPRPKKLETVTTAGAENTVAASVTAESFYTCSSKIRFFTV
jgi:hypothetical protein